MSFNLVTANIKSTPRMRQSYVDSDIETVRPLGDVIMWQEIHPDRYKNAVTALLPENQWTHVNLQVEVPISLRKSEWTVIDSGIRTTHTGRTAVTPNRYLSWAVAERVGSNIRVLFLNTHYVSAAWSNNRPLTKAWRRTRWNYHFKVMDEMVTRYVDAGYTVIGGGDWNRGDSTPKFLSTQRWLNTGSIDRMFVVEAPTGIEVRLDDMHTKTGLHTDHHPRVTELTLKRKPGYEVPTKSISLDDLPILRTK